MSLPPSIPYIVIGAGIHGLSTAWNLAKRLPGGGEDVLVIDKHGMASGASGIACGVIRNNYYQPAMRELMAHSVRIWESDPKAFSYHPVGYMQISCEAMRSDVAQIAREQQEIGYESVFVDGARDSLKYMRDLLDDWQARGITSVLHEKKGGYANNTASVYGLAGKAEALDRLTSLWPEMLDRLGYNLVEPSREQYLRYALSVWHDFIDQGDGSPEMAVAALGVLEVLCEE